MYFRDEEADADLIAALDGGGGELVPERVFAGLADHDTTFALLNRYSATSPFAGLGFRAGQWFETTEAIYWHFLESLPPRVQTGHGFVTSECVTGDLYEGFLCIAGRYFCAVVRGRAGRGDLTRMQAHIAAEVTP